MIVDREIIIAEELAKREPFQWGIRDCCMWAADVSHRITGIDYAEPLRGTYNSKGGAIRHIAKAGGLDELMSELLGEPVPIRNARTGDIVTAFVPELAAGICVGHRAIFLKESGEFHHIDLAGCWRVWSV